MELKEAEVIAGLPIADRAFKLLDGGLSFIPQVPKGNCAKRRSNRRDVRQFRCAANRRKSSIKLGNAFERHRYFNSEICDKIADLPVQLVDTRKTTPGLRLLEKYATQVGGASDHRMGLDDAVIINDDRIAAAGGIAKAIALIRNSIPYPLTIEVETETLAEVETALQHKADIIMLDNMSFDLMRQAVAIIRQKRDRVKIEASGNVTLETIRSVAETGVDYISTSAATRDRLGWI